MLNLSINGAGFLAEERIPEKEKDLKLNIFHTDYKPITLPIEKITFRGAHPSGKNSMGILFRKDLGSQREDLFELLYVHLPKSEASKLYRVNTWSPANLFKKAHAVTN